MSSSGAEYLQHLLDETQYLVAASKGLTADSSPRQV